jgi:uncharacterized protein YycO
VKVLFCTSTLPGATLIRAVTWSNWSHVALIDGDYVIEAAWPVVRRVPLVDVLKKHNHFQIVDLPCDNPRGVIEAAKSQIGKPYDLTALFGFLAHRDWQDTNKWFCSELVAWAFDAAGSPLFRPEALHRVTPQHLWMLSPIPRHSLP